MYYHRREPVLGKWWIQMVDKEGERFYEEDRTPCVYMLRGRRDLMDWTEYGI